MRCRAARRFGRFKGKQEENQLAILMCGFWELATFFVWFKGKAQGKPPFGGIVPLVGFEGRSKGRPRRHVPQFPENGPLL